MTGDVDGAEDDNGVINSSNATNMLLWFICCCCLALVVGKWYYLTVTKRIGKDKVIIGLYVCDILLFYLFVILG